MELRIDRTRRTPLVAQLEAALKEEIRSRRLRPGDFLPGFREIARQCAVCENVVRRALLRLSADGWIEAKRGIGTVVKGDRTGAGRVLFLDGDYGAGYFASIKKHALRRTLEAAGIQLVEAGVLDGRGRIRLSAIEGVLKSPWAFVVECRAYAEIRRLLVSSGIPFVASPNLPPPGKDAQCVGTAGGADDAGLEAFVRECARKNVKSVWQVMYGDGPFDVTARLSSFGVAVRTIHVPLCPDHEKAIAKSRKCMLHLLRTERDRLPDLVFVSDDVVAQGVLFAMMELGVVVPDEVRLVTHVNRGIGLLWPRKLTCLLCDPCEAGRNLGKAIVRYFRTGEWRCETGGPAWMKGDTF